MKQGARRACRSPGTEIRINHFSSLSERCPLLAILQTIALFSVRCKLQAKLPPSHPRLNRLCLTCFNEYKNCWNPEGGGSAYVWWLEACFKASYQPARKECNSDSHQSGVYATKVKQCDADL